MTTTETPIDIWDRRHASEQREECTSHEPWLERWTHLLDVRYGYALDLGCGIGFDTSALLGLGFEVVALDFSKNAIAVSKQKNPRATHVIADIRQLDEVVLGEFAVIVANRSLHYFDRVETEAAFATVSKLLPAGGLLLFRVNAYDEPGAPADRDSWELVTVDGIPRQFFDEKKIRHLLGETLESISVEKRTANRFGRSKSLFEVVAVKRARAAGRKSNGTESSP
jgi:SAM-dependent methyltransferase